MPTLANRKIQEVCATNIRFDKDILYVSLSDYREISLPIKRIDWLEWLAKATPEQQSNWTIEAGGFAIYWEDLDDGIEVCHLLSMHPMT
jgi:hypothetical protein